MLYLLRFSLAVVAQLVEHPHGKGEVIGSTPINGSKWKGLNKKKSCHLSSVGRAFLNLLMVCSGCIIDLCQILKNQEADV